MRKKKLVVISIIVFVALAAALALLMTLSPDSTPPSAEEQSPPPPPSHVDTVMQNMTLQEKVASLFVLHTPGTNAEHLQSFASQYNLGGLILMGDNIPESHEALHGVAAAIYGDDAKLPRLVMTDQEGGTVRRIPGDTFASALDLKTQPASATYNAFEARSELVQSVGVTLNLGIVADVTADPNSFIYPRVLGTTPQAAADRVQAAVKASQRHTLSTLKHFPGHGETTADSHVSIPVSGISFDEWRQRDAVPFEAGIAAGANVVMTGHLRYSSVDTLPASLSAKWHDTLRRDMKFQGVIMTDDMVMLQNSGESAFSDPVQNAVSALAAGSDLVLYVLQNQDDPASQIDPQRLLDGVVAAVQDGKINAAQLDQSVKRVLGLREKSATLIQK
jgi:beta-N-acetylhexosaminidase